MKKFIKNITLVLLLVVSVSFLFTACGKKEYRKNVPNAEDLVYGNGGLAVKKGDYLYFVNGYKTYSDVKDEKDNENVVRGAIYKTKLTNVGSLDMGEVLDDNGEVKSKYVKDVERVVDKIACFENGGIYIVGNYLYYTTPNTHDDKDANLLNKLVDYCRVPLNEYGHGEVLYTSDDEVTDGDWAPYEIDGNIYLVIKNEAKVICVKNSDKPITMVNDSNNIVLTKTEDNKVLSEFEKYVYYTRDAKTEDKVSTGNVLARVKIGSTTEEIIRKDNKNTYNVLDVKNDSIYYTKDDRGCLYVANAINFTNETQLTYKKYSSTYIVNNNDSTTTLNRVLVVTSEGEEGSEKVKFEYFDNGSVDSNLLLEIDGKADVLDVQGNYVYYYHNNTIKRVDILSGETTDLIKDKNNFSFSATQKMAFDVDGNYMYLLNGVTSGEATNYYLNRVDLLTLDRTFIGAYEKGEELKEQTEENQDSNLEVKPGN